VGGRPGAEPAPVAAVAPAVATRLAGVSIEAVADLADAEIRLGRADTAAARLTALLAEQPDHERAAALLMDGLAAQGRQGEALTVYERIRTALADHLGADPGAALRDRHLRLLRSVSTVVAQPVEPAADTAPPSNVPAPRRGARAAPRVRRAARRRLPVARRARPYRWSGSRAHPARTGRAGRGRLRRRVRHGLDAGRKDGRDRSRSGPAPPGARDGGPGGGQQMTIDDYVVAQSGPLDIA
jgi:hypothetical protein